MTCMGDCLKKKKAAGLNAGSAKNVAICLSECGKSKESKNTEHDYFQPIPKTYKIVEFR